MFTVYIHNYIIWEQVLVFSEENNCILIANCKPKSAKGKVNNFFNHLQWHTSLYDRDTLQAEVKHPNQQFFKLLNKYNDNPLGVTLYL